MKSFILSIALVCNTLIINAQSTLWGMTPTGGSGGTIYSIPLGGGTQTVSSIFAPKTPGFGSRRGLIQATNGKFYGMCSQGGLNGVGVLYEYDLATNVYTVIKDFNSIDGKTPEGTLIQATNGNLYGMTTEGGANDAGVIFEFNIITNIYTIKFNFDFGTATGYNPKGGLLQASNGKLYGATYSGGNYYYGVLFEYDITTNTYTKKYDFDNIDGANPIASLIQANNGKLYGTTFGGGVDLIGVLFEYEISTNTFFKKFDFTISSGGYPNGDLMQATNGKLYGLTSWGALNYFGCLYEFDILTNIYTNKYDFDLNSYGSKGNLIESSTGKLVGVTEDDGINYSGVIFEYDFVSSSYTIKKSFGIAPFSGRYPFCNIIKASNGKIYGVTEVGAIVPGEQGLIFEYDLTTNTLNDKLFFQTSEGHTPYGSLCKATNGKLYGYTNGGGTFGYGTFFEFNPITNTKTIIKNFSQSGGDGTYISGTPLQASNGKIYGMLSVGEFNFGMAIIFEYDISTNTYTETFDLNAIGVGGSAGGLIQASNGKLYGMSNAYIIEYDIITQVASIVFDFTTSDAVNPYGKLMQASNGKLYGTTNQGGLNFEGVIFEFDLTTNTYTKKIDLINATGAYPYCTLREFTNGKLYGTTSSGGVNSAGTLFEYDFTSNTYIPVFNFQYPISSSPYGSLLLASDNKFYGTTYYGGTNNIGTVFQFEPITNTLNYILNFDGGNFGENPRTDLIELGAPTPLPIELLSFEGKKNEGYNDIQWITATELNNDFFELQKSSDAITWQKIAVVKSKGNSYLKQFYNYNDYEQTNEIEYYRLKQIDLDKTYTYSQIISIENEVNKKTDFIIYPNPSNGKLSLTNNKPCQLTITNTLGQVIVKQSIPSFANIQLPTLPNGIYYITSSLNNTSKKLIINN